MSLSSQIKHNIERTEYRRACIKFHGNHQLIIRDHEVHTKDGRGTAELSRNLSALFCRMGRFKAEETPENLLAFQTIRDLGIAQLVRSSLNQELISYDYLGLLEPIQGLARCPICGQHAKSISDPFRREADCIFLVSGDAMWRCMGCRHSGDVFDLAALFFHVADFGALCNLLFQILTQDFGVKSA